LFAFGKSFLLGKWPWSKSVRFYTILIMIVLQLDDLSGESKSTHIL